MAVLKMMRVPAIVVELVGLTYRFIYVLLETTRRVYVAQDARLGYTGVRTSYRSLGMLVSSLIVRTLRYARELEVSLESRGYTGELNVLQIPYQVSWKNIIAIMTIDGILIAVAVLI
ncbi:Cobalt transport protein [Candidatus Magnetobacterium bavaricum]|uniref:Cobalt transport protein n=1 Tax=Candidatus Magnetobacterium bavaricum TaxID=29290 RepID=A0A0F3GQG1_9BACT|nr:Cobalt transport protein [Candidatus Magnetobacterium bavaricum]